MKNYIQSNKKKIIHDVQLYNGHNVYNNVDVGIYRHVLLQEKLPHLF